MKRTEERTNSLNSSFVRTSLLFLIPSQMEQVQSVFKTVLIDIAVLPSVVSNGDGLKIAEGGMDHAGVEVEVVIGGVHQQTVLPSPLVNLRDLLVGSKGAELRPIGLICIHQVEVL